MSTYCLYQLSPEHFPSFLCRSPGGTPIRRRRSKGGAALLGDPAALIAEALKRKFAQHRHNNSADKENSLELSPFGSPEIPKVPLHTRRSQGRLHLWSCWTVTSDPKSQTCHQPVTAPTDVPHKRIIAAATDLHFIFTFVCLFFCSCNSVCLKWTKCLFL